MKKRALILLFLLFLPIAFAQDWVFNSEYITVNLDISGKLTLVPKSSSYTVEYVSANLSFVPENGFQEEVLDIQTNPITDVKKGVAMFKWDNPSSTDLSFSIKSNVKIFNKIKGVGSKIPFPISDLPEDVTVYTKPSETIDSNDVEIIKKASEIAAGEDDLYVIIFKLADWTKNNIRYDLSTLTESVSQKASWVLKNREGVCDELTNLFIAMNRALGIPAKFISGVAYTNAEPFGETFGPHGWAEVYFPDYGWIPFDVTYGEFGFVDAGHIKLKESMDANDASTRFQWLGRNIDIKTSPLDIKANLKDTNGRIDDYISINARAVKGSIGFGSYNLIEATVKNLKDYYTATELRLSRTKETETIGEEEKSLLLKPEEEKKVSWIIKISDNLEQGYAYTFPVLVSSTRNATASLKFDVTREGKVFSLEGIEDLLNENSEERIYSKNVELNCKSDKTEIYEYESAIIGCNIKNIGNVYLDNLNICLEEDCKKTNLGITQEERIIFNFKPKKAAAQEITIKAKNKDVSKNSFVEITVRDKPSINISDLIFPQEVRYKDTYEISFLLSKKSKFPPHNVTIKIEPVNKEWVLNQLNENRKFVLKMYGKELNVGNNNFNILIIYSDKNGKEYKTNTEFTVKLADVNIFQRIIIFFNNIGRKIIGVFRG